MPSNSPSVILAGNQNQSYYVSLQFEDFRLAICFLNLDFIRQSNTHLICKSDQQVLITDNLDKLQTKTYAISCAKLSEDPPKDTTASDMLVESFGRIHFYLRTSLSERCNLRYQYRMPADGVELTPNPSLIFQSEIICLAGLFVITGVDKIRLTSGELTVKKDIEDVCL